MCRSIKNAIFNVDDYSMPQTHVQGVVYEGEREWEKGNEREREGVRKVLAILLAQLHVSFPPQTLMLTPPHNITQSQRGCLFSLVSLSLVRFPLADRQAKRDAERGRGREGKRDWPDSTFRCSRLGAA